MPANKPAADQIVPFNVEAEEAVLGSALLDSEVVGQLAAQLLPEDFFREKNRWTWEAMLALDDRRQGVDFITVRAELERRGRLDEVGGPSFLVSLLNAVATSTHARHYASLVTKAATRRRLIQAASQIAEIAYDQSVDEDVVKDRAEAALFAAVDGTRRGEQGYRELGDILAQLHDRRYTDGAIKMPITTGFDALNEITGGWQRKEMTLVMGAPGVGKTSTVLTFLVNAARAGYVGGIASVEMDGGRVADRLVRMETGIPAPILHLPADRAPDADLRRISQANGVLDALGIRVVYEPGMTIQTLRRLTRQAHRRKPFDLLVVDYVQLMTAGGDKGTATRNDELQLIAYELTEMAKELDVHILVASQLRKMEGRNARPSIFDTRDSLALAQAANNAVAVWRPDYDGSVQIADPVILVELLVLKQRDGATSTVNLGWYGAESRLVSIAEMRQINEAARQRQEAAHAY